MKPLHIFKSGQHTAMSGLTDDYSDEMLRRSADAYDPAKHEAPIVVGHPTHDAPAYGWIKRVAFQNGDYTAEPHQVEPAFSEMVQEGRFKKISARFYGPDHIHNPVPGTLYLKDVGFLGAQAPAVKGLKTVEFSEEGEGNVVSIEVAFAEVSDSTLAMLFRGIREYLIETAGQDTADRAIPGWAIDEMTMLPAMMMRSAEPGPMFAEKTEERDMGDEAKEQALQQREIEVAAREAALARKEHLAFAEGLRKDFKIHPGQVNRVAELLVHLDRTPQEAEFAEGEGQRKETPVEALKAFMESLPPMVGGKLPEESAPQGSTDPAEVARQAIAFQEAEAKKGITISVSQAVQQILKGGQ